MIVCDSAIVAAVDSLSGHGDRWQGASKILIAGNRSESSEGKIFISKACSLANMKLQRLTMCNFSNET